MLFTWKKFRVLKFFRWLPENVLWCFLENMMIRWKVSVVYLKIMLFTWNMYFVYLKYLFTLKYDDVCLNIFRCFLYLMLFTWKFDVYLKIFCYLLEHLLLFTCTWSNFVVFWNIAVHFLLLTLTSSVVFFYIWCFFLKIICCLAKILLLFTR